MSSDQICESINVVSEEKIYHNALKNMISQFDRSHFPWYTHKGLVCFLDNDIHHNKKIESFNRSVTVLTSPASLKAARKDAINTIINFLCDVLLSTASQDFDRNQSD